MRDSSWTKRLGMLLAVGIVASACGSSSVSPVPPAPTTNSVATPAGSATPAAKVPSKPVTINVLDVAGNLQLTKQMMENFKAAHPEMVANITYSTATAPELAGKLQAQQAGGNAQISLVMTGTDGLAAGIKNNLLTKITPDHEDMFPNLTANYLEPAAAMQGLAQGYGIEVVYYPSGPLLEYNPTKVTTPPTTPCGTARLGQGTSRQVRVRPPGQLGPGPNIPYGSPVSARRQGPHGPDQRLGQHLGVLEGSRPVHQGVPDRHHSDHEGPGKRHG